jgi:putative ABC transport system permease protein
MSVFRQCALVATLSLRSLPQRLGTSLVIVTGVCGVVGVLVSILALGTGVRHTFQSGGREDRVVVLREGMTSERGSSLSTEAVAAIENAEGVRRVNGMRVAATEVIATLRTQKKDGRVGEEVAFRGIRTDIPALRPEMRLMSGRMLRTGLREVIVGRGLHERSPYLQLGDTIEFTDSEWTVVGIFSNGGNAHESEVWGDVESVRAAFKRRSYDSATVMLENAESLQAFTASVQSRPGVAVAIFTEAAYLEERAKPLQRVLFVVGYIIGGIMTFGAFFAAINTMYSVVSGRMLEIATLRAIGFGPAGVVASVMIEALVLSLIGGALGAAVAWCFFDGMAASTYTDEDTQLAFELTVDAGLVLTGLLWGCAIGIAGGFIPAIRAARLQVADALRLN